MNPLCKRQFRILATIFAVLCVLFSHLSGNRVSGPIAQQSLNVEGITITAPGTADIYLAGQPTGAMLGGDKVPNNSPIDVGLSLTPGMILTIRAMGATNNRPEAPPAGATPDGGPLLTIGPAFGLSAITAPVNSLVGVFLGPEVPNPSTTLNPLNFFSAESRNFISLMPALQQVFFIGDGVTDTSTEQQFTVPPGASRLFLGSADVAGANFNNRGMFSVTVTVIPAPLNLMVIGSASSPVPLVDVAILGNIALASSPAFYSDEEGSRLAGGIETLGHTAYVLSGRYTEDVEVFDISTITSPRRLRGLDGGGNGDDVSSFDISDPANPRYLSNADLPGSTGTTPDMTSLGRFLLIAQNGRGLQIFDTGSRFDVISEVGTPGGAEAVARTSDFAYVADHRRGVQIINLSPLSSPAIIGQVGLPENGLGLDVSDTELLVADGASGLVIFNINDDGGLTQIGRVPTRGVARRMKSIGNLAFIADDKAGLTVIDTVTMRIVALANIGGQALGLAVDATRKAVFTATNDAGLKIVDVSPLMTTHDLEDYCGEGG